jgi:hypothetical protein
VAGRGMWKSRILRPLVLCKHLLFIVDFALTSSAPTKFGSGCPGAPLALPAVPGSLAAGGLHAKLDVDLRISTSLGMPSIRSFHENKLFALQDWGRADGSYKWQLRILIAWLVY